MTINPRHDRIWSDADDWSDYHTEAMDRGICFGGGGGGRTQTVTQTQSLDPAIRDRWLRVMDQADAVADRPFEQFQGPRVAGFSGDQQNAFNRVRGMQGQADGQLGFAQGVAQGVASGYNPMLVNAGQAPGAVRSGSFAGSDLNPYLNPFLAEVEQNALTNIDRARQNQINQIQGQAIQRGAFGGSRMAIREGVADAEAARMAGEMSANLRAQGFNTAAGLMQTDQARALQADLANQQSSLGFNAQRIGAEQANQAAAAQAAQMRLQASGLMGDLAQRRQQLTANEINMLNAVGQEQQALDQAFLDQNYQNWADRRNYPVEQLNLRLAALSQMPAERTGTTTSPVTGQNRILGGLGGAASGAAIGSMFMPGIGTAVGAGLGALGGIFSDDRAKKDIEKIGEIPGTGLNAYSFRYRGDSASSPKVVGLLASEVEREYPEAVREVAGMRAIDPAFMGSLGFGRAA